MQMDDNARTQGESNRVQTRRHRNASHVGKVAHGPCSARVGEIVFRRDVPTPPESDTESPPWFVIIFILMDRKTCLSSARPPVPAPRACRCKRGFMVGLLLVSAFGSWPLGASAQPVERGAFQLFQDGRPVGREDFEIRRSGTGDAQITLARGTVTMRSGLVAETVLHVRGPTMTLIEYRVDVSGADTATVRLERVGDYIHVNIDEPEGERGREYRARPMTFVLEDGVAHHYFALAMFTTSDVPAAVHALAPRTGEPETTASLGVATDVLEIDGVRVEATRVQLSADGGQGVAWFDGSGDLVQVEVPTQGYRAIRIP